MPSKKMEKFLDKTPEELKQLLAEMEQEYEDARFDHATIGTQNPLSLREQRRDIARVKTLIRKLELDAMTEEQKAKRTKIIRRRRKRR